MGVDMNATLELRYESEYDLRTLYWSPVCSVWCGRFYHWRDLITDNDAALSGTFPFKRLHQIRKYPMFDAAVKDTDLYAIACALAEKHGKKNVRISWDAS